ncbi:MAG: chorismate-binding protein [Cytophagales bacterium]|nr:chorismate-binding protein [Cytophagales bacterium]
MFLKAHLHYIFRPGGWEENSHPVPVELRGDQSRFETLVAQYAAEGEPFRAEQTVDADGYVCCGDEERRFKASVTEAVRAIDQGRFQKVVLSRQKKIALPAGLDRVRTYLRLCRYYPQAFVSLVSVPGKGTWMGASPEVLISVDKHQVFRTMALAGTQPYRPEVPLSDVSWTQKEIEEQALVSRYIINCFKQIRLREFEEDGPKTVVAGNLLHLRTDFRVDMRATGFPQLGTVMLRLLHPTSAVCGMPKEPALQFIREQEGYDRAFYSGFLGPVNIGAETHLYVNLRCTQLLEGGAILYAGAGITASSVPEKEWRETELKCQTMYRVLGAAN